MDEFERHSSGLDSPGRRAVAVVPNDGADLSTVCRALYVGASGSVHVTTVAGDDATFQNVAGGSVLPVRCARVHATGTTATDIVALS